MIVRVRSNRYLTECNAHSILLLVFIFYLFNFVFPLLPSLSLFLHLVKRKSFKGKEWTKFANCRLRLQLSFDLFKFCCGLLFEVCLERQHDPKMRKGKVLFFLVLCLFWAGVRATATVSIILFFCLLNKSVENNWLVKILCAAMCCFQRQWDGTRVPIFEHAFLVSFVVTRVLFKEGNERVWEGEKMRKPCSNK